MVWFILFTSRHESPATVTTPSPSRGGHLSISGYVGWLATASRAHAEAVTPRRLAWWAFGSATEPAVVRFCGVGWGELQCPGGPAIPVWKLPFGTLTVCLGFPPTYADRG